MGNDNINPEFGTEEYAARAAEFRQAVQEIYSDCDPSDEFLGILTMDPFTVSDETANHAIQRAYVLAHPMLVDLRDMEAAHAALLQMGDQDAAASQVEQYEKLFSKVNALGAVITGLYAGIAARNASTQEEAAEAIAQWQIHSALVAIEAAVYAWSYQDGTASVTIQPSPTVETMMGILGYEAVTLVVEAAVLQFLDETTKEG